MTTESPPIPPSLVRPRIELEPGPALRLEEVLPVPNAEPDQSLPSPWRGPALAIAGIAAILLGFALVWAADLITGLFARASLLAWPATALLAAGFALILAGFWRELRGLAGLRRVDTLRTGLQSSEIGDVRRAARSWLAALPASAETTRLTAAIDATDDPEALRALLAAGPGAALTTQAEALGRTAAWQVAAMIAATPSPSLDALVVGWRGVRLVRQVAALHGMRPGLAGTLALIRRTAFAAASVALTEAAVNAASAALLSNPLLDRVLGDVAGAGVAARRMVLLARAAAQACTPLRK